MHIVTCNCSSSTHFVSPPGKHFATNTAGVELETILITMINKEDICYDLFDALPDWHLFSPNTGMWTLYEKNMGEMIAHALFH